jgi:hypothetical protein
VQDLKAEIGEVLKPEIERLKDEAEAVKAERLDMERRVEEMLKEVE